MLLCISLGVVCIFDYTRGKIPNFFPVGLAVTGTVRSLYYESMAGAVRYLLVAAAVLLLLYPLFKIGGLGAGDVKLLSVCAGYLPVSKIFVFLFISMLISAIFSVIPVLKEGNVKERAAYFCEYCLAVVCSGKWHLYLPQKAGRRFRGVCMSGPILCSVLMCLGGFY